MSLVSVQQVAWQFHTHEDATHEKRDEDADKGDAQQQDPIETWGRLFVGLIQHNEAKAAQREEKT